MALRSSLAILTAVAGLAAAAPAAAGSVEIGPISVQMVGRERTATMTVTNPTAEAESLQIRTVDWSQDQQTGDRYTPSETLIASPPVVHLKAGESQTVRLVLEAVPEGGTERSYRVILDELPQPADTSGAGVRTAIRVLAPVFLTPSLEARPKLSWTASRTAGGVLVTAHNDGDVHERLADLRFEADGRVLGAGAVVDGYVLSHSSRAWMLSDAPAGAGALTAAASGAHGAVQAHVPIGQ